MLTGRSRVLLALAGAASALACVRRETAVLPSAIGSAEIESAPVSLLSCDLADEPASAPTFEFDSAQLSQRGRETLARIAACWRDGRLGRSKLVVVGFADPRGPASYNRQLALYRGFAAREALVDFGVPRAVIAVESRGEREARGDRESTWALDRRVEIRFERERE